MAGVCGIVDSASGTEAMSERLLPMLHAAPHLGPDGVAKHVEPGVGLVQFLDHQTPESVAVTSPLRDALLGLSLVADIRLDNREQLAEKLALDPTTLAEMPDEGVLLAGFRRWGIEVVEHLLGDFFFALWESRRRRLWLVRDHLGVRSGFYARQGQRFWFASELNQILACQGVPARPNLRRIADFLSFSFEENHSTFYEDILRVAPGTILALEGELTTPRRYYALGFTPELKLKDHREYSQAFRELLVDSTRRRLRTRVPTGFLLSGGLDSSSLVGIAVDSGLLASQGPVRTFSATFPDYPAIDERSYIQHVHARSAFDAHFVRVDRTSPLAGLAREIEHQAEPFYSPNNFVDTLLVDQAQRAGVRLILDGLDGDTTVGHGWEFLGELLRRGRWRRLVRLAREFDHNTDRSTGWFLWRHALGPTLSGLSERMVLKRPALLSPALAARVGWRERAEEVRRGTPGSLASFREQHWHKLASALLPMCFELAGRQSGLRGIGRRHPYFDRRLAEFCVSLPAEQRLDRGVDRIIQRRAAEGFTPEEIRTRLTKSVWIQNFVDRMRIDERATIAAWLTKADTPIAEFVDLPALRKRCNDALNGRGDEHTLTEIWVACALELWFARGRK